MRKRTDLIWAISAMGIYVMGGLTTFTGIAMAAFLSGTDVGGWGDGKSLGYLVLCLGFFFSIMGVMLMRIYRNRYGVFVPLTKKNPPAAAGG